MKRLMWAILLLMTVVSADAARVIKVLAIGNSFSEDAIEQYLYELAAAQGDSLVIGNAYIGGCSIDRHWSNAQTGKPEYRYRKIVGGKTATRHHVALDDIIADDQWDIISLQQASHFSGLPYTFANLQRLKDHVLSICPNKQVEIVWHMTWAYAKGSDHWAFRFYRHDQQLMYNNICLTMADQLPRVGISRIIPVGMAVQKARGKMGDVLCRDGFHLNKAYERYTAACTWCEFLTGRKVVGNTYHLRASMPRRLCSARRWLIRLCATSSADTDHFTFGSIGGDSVPDSRACFHRFFIRHSHRRDGLPYRCRKKSTPYYNI